MCGPHNQGKHNCSSVAPWSASFASGRSFLPAHSSRVQFGIMARCLRLLRLPLLSTPFVRVKPSSVSSVTSEFYRGRAFTATTVSHAIFDLLRFSSPISTSAGVIDPVTAYSHAIRHSHKKSNEKKACVVHDMRYKRIVLLVMARCHSPSLGRHLPFVWLCYLCSC